ncbi:hypothetical protein D5086_005873, partial [Populus alba]
KRREFYENAKYVSKFKKKLKQQNQPNELSSAVRSSGVPPPESKIQMTNSRQKRIEEDSDYEEPGQRFKENLFKRCDATPKFAEEVEYKWP